MRKKAEKEEEGGRKGREGEREKGIKQSMFPLRVFTENFPVCCPH